MHGVKGIRGASYTIVKHFLEKCASKFVIVNMHRIGLTKRAIQKCGYLSLASHNDQLSWL
jgi:hypothetical protein